MAQAAQTRELDLPFGAPMIKIQSSVRLAKSYASVVDEGTDAFLTKALPVLKGFSPGFIAEQIARMKGKSRPFQKIYLDGDPLAHKEELVDEFHAHLDSFGKQMRFDANKLRPYLLGGAAQNP